jgi:hypothetical protein
MEFGRTILSMIVTLLIVTSVAGCFESGKVIEADDNLTGYNIEFKLKMITENIRVGSEEILIKVSIRNKESDSLRIYKEGLFYCGIFIVDPENITFPINRGNITIDNTKIILKPNKVHSSEIDLKKEYYENRTHGRLSWDKAGRYQCQAKAYFIESNWIEFEIKK